MTLSIDSKKLAALIQDALDTTDGDFNTSTMLCIGKVGKFQIHLTIQGDQGEFFTSTPAKDRCVWVAKDIAVKR